MLLSLSPKTPTLRFLVFARLLCVVAIFGFTYCGGPQDVAAQFDGGGGGIDGGGGAGISDLNDLSNLNGTIGNRSGTGDQGAFGENIGEVLGGVDTTDLRNQGFVGPTGTRIQELGFVGPPGETSGPPLAEGASFGGGTNDVGLANNGGGGGGRANNQNRDNGFGGTGEVKGFEVFRSSVRANLRSQFSYPQVNGNDAAYRFQHRIRRLPDMANDGAGVQISISNRTATIQGFVGSGEESKRIERQLRLEPGIYKINNYATIAGP